MKKKILTLGFVMALSITTATGCASKNDYESDIEAFLEIDELGFDDYDELIDELKDMKLHTSKGKAVRDSFLKAIEIMDEGYEMMESGDADTEELQDMKDELHDVVDKLEDQADEFFDAAEEKGVDEDDIEELQDSGLFQLD